ncbi:chromate transporter [Acinetobacter calcoaceticus]|uniref:Chromate transporter n=1 Tax=Acinetobacter calcoaceticus TaxID=471 RepID=A0A4R1XM80_ACICA|nr:chromate transporter [Acinetobacter calcoaceticus]
MSKCQAKFAVQQPISTALSANKKHSDQLIVPTNPQLFWGFMKLAVIGFGGVLPMAQSVLVEQQKWLSTAQFTDLLGICQILPGGNIINMTVVIGMRFQGLKGALSALLGLISAPTLIVVLSYQLYAQFQHIPTIQHIIQGLAAAAAGLLFATGFKLLKPILKGRLTYVTLLLCALLLLVFKLPLLLTLFILVSINLYWTGVTTA